MKDKDYTYTGYNSHLKEKAKELRKNITRQEKRLWYGFLNSRKERWYRQRIINNYIADFYCPSAKIVIELDGKQHYYDENVEYDTVRTEIMNLYNIKVMRFSNLEIDNCFSDVCRKINEEYLKASHN